MIVWVGSKKEEGRAQEDGRHQKVQARLAGLSYYLRKQTDKPTRLADI